MSGLRLPGRRAAALVLALCFIAPSLAAGAASAGALSSFVEGPTPLLTSSAVPNATLSFPNPARALSAQVDISTESSTRATTLPGPNFARWAEWSICPNLEEPASAFAGTPLNASDLPRISSQDGSNWTQPSTLFGCGVLVVEFDTTLAMDPQGAPFIDATIEVAADATASPGQSNITVALFEEPVVGRPFLQPLALSPSAPGAFAATIVHPPLIARGPQKFLELVLFCPDGGYNLTVDEVRVTLRAPLDPKSPVVVVANSSAVAWQFRGPGNRDAFFGRSLEDTVGNTAMGFPSVAGMVDGTTVPLFVPKGAQVTSAYLDLLPEAFADTRANASGLANYTVAALSASPLSASPQVEGFPVYALPTEGTITLYGLTAHGVIGENQLASDQSFTVGNLTTLERSRAQVFTVGVGGAIEALEIELADATGHPVGPLVVELHTVNATGVPTDTVLATSVGNTTTARPGGLLNFTFFPEVIVSQGQQLAAVLASPGATAAQTWDWRGLDGISTDPYTGGLSFVSTKANGTGPWSPQSGFIDFVFRVRMHTAFNASLAPFVTPAGASGFPLETLNYSGGETGWTWTVPGSAIDVAPDGQGGGIWQVPIIDGLDFGVEYRWDASFAYDVTPRAVDIGIGNRSAFLSLPQVDHRVVVDFTAELAAALSGGDYVEVPQGPNMLAFFPLRIHATGPANLTLAAFDIAYGVTITATGFEGALNTRLAAAPPGAQADVQLVLQAAAGSLRLSNVNVEYSEAPFSPPIVQPPMFVPEASQNFTFANLYEWFVDDQGPLGLTFAVDLVSPPNVTAAVWMSQDRANLTLTLNDTEFSGDVQVTARAIDFSGLSATRVFNVTVVSVEDPPVIAPLPDATLPATTGTYDLSGYISDEDTHPSGVEVGVSSVFATVLGYTISFDYRNAPSDLLRETMTVWANDGTSNVSAPLVVFINNGGRPQLFLPGPLTVAMSHDLALDLRDFAQDDTDPPAQLTWSVILVAGVGGAPGAAEITPVGARAITIHPTLPGDVAVNLSVRDRDGNLAVGTLRLHIVANQGPTFATLHGATFQLAQSSEVRIVISDYLADPDDGFANFTFAISWEGQAGNATREGGDLVIRPVGSAGGPMNVTVLATDPGGLTATATFTVTVAPGPGGDASSFGLVPLLFVLGLLGLGAIFLLSYKRGKKRPASLSSLEREDADVDEGDEDDGTSPGEKGPPGLEETDEDQLLKSLDKLEAAAERPKVELPPPTIFGVANAKASTLLLFYRDGRPISWGATSSPADADREAAQELGASLQQMSGKETSAERAEWVTLEAEGRKMVVEARAQLVLGAVMNPGTDEAIFRLNMRAALEKIFDGHAERLKRWDGNRRGLGGVDDILESLLRR